MLAYLKGEIIEKNLNSLVLDVNGVGYFVLCSVFTISELGKVGEIETINTYMSVKQDSIEIYGFKTLEEKEVFLNLISVSGVGVKSALQMISAMNYKKLAKCIETRDADNLTLNKVCSKKTAERVILELKNKKFGFGESSESTKSMLDAPPLLNDAILALMSLGLNKKEATIRAGEVFLGSESSAEEIVKKALKNF